MADDATNTETSTTTAETPNADATALGGAATAVEETTGTVKVDGDGSQTVADGDKIEGETSQSEKADDKSADGVPEAYELTAPEGFTIDQASIDLVTPVFKEIGLNNEQANKLMPVAAQWAQQIQDGHNSTILAQVQADRRAWLDTAKADPEIGGAHWDDTLTTAASALDRLGLTKGSAFRTLLDESGLGNHPEMIRAFRLVGKAIGEDTNFIRAGSGAPTKRDAAETLYPDDQPRQGA